MFSSVSRASLNYDAVSGCDLANANQLTRALRRTCNNFDAGALKFGVLMKLLRIALTGEQQGLPVMHIVGFLGKQETVQRLSEVEAAVTSDHL